LQDTAPAPDFFFLALHFHSDTLLSVERQRNTQPRKLISDTKEISFLWR
jgi:hypothetical protein